jgi:hypothetical protein
MQTSHIIEVNGVFLGAAVTLGQHSGVRFVATDPRVSALDGSVLGDVQEARRRAADLYRSVRAPSLPAEGTVGA